MLAFYASEKSRDSHGRWSGPGNTANVIWHEAGVPMMLLEQRIGPSRKLNRIATTEDRMTLGRELIALMAEVAR